MFIYDSGETVFVWVGSNASPAEKKNGLPVAHVSKIACVCNCVIVFCIGYAGERRSVRVQIWTGS